jgi:ABC-type transport system involved in multi-copper enzyme maturation permease subunit
VRLPPQPLSVLALGAEAWVGNDVSVAVHYRLEAPSIRPDLSNDFMKSLVPIDVVTVVAVVLSFLAVALGFDGISGERESGTLRQLMAQPVARSTVILAKLLGGCLALWLPLSVAFILSQMILLANPDYGLSADGAIRVALIFLISCLFLAQVYAGSLLVSTLVERSATSLILCLFAWLLGGVVWMNMAPFVGDFGMRETPWQTYMDGSRRLYSEYEADIAAWEEQHPSPGRAYTQGLETDGVLRFAHPQGYAWLTQRSRYQVERLKRLADDTYDIRWYGMHDERAEQALFADRWAPLSPWDNYRVLTYRLARTTIDDKLHLGERVRHYREGFVQWLRGRDGFGRRWFTDDPPQQAPMIVDPVAATVAMMQEGSAFLQARLAWARAENRRLEARTQRRLDLTAMPRFEAAEGYRSLPASLATMLPGLAVLIVSLAVVVPATVLRFQTYEPHR